VSEFIQQKLRWCVVPGGERKYYLLTGRHKEVEHIPLRKNILSAFCRYQNYLKKLSVAYSAYEDEMKGKNIKPLSFEIWFERELLLTERLIKLDIQKEPSLLSWDLDEHTFHYFDPAILKIVAPVPAWEEFLSRCTMPDIFLAWVGALFDPKNVGKQLMYLVGEGNDGKTTVAKALSTILEGHAAVIQECALGKPFFFSGLYGKRLAILSDCMDPKIVGKSAIHLLTGGDPVSIEFKGAPPFQAPLNCKLLICSNKTPEIDDVENMRTRLLCMRVNATSLALRAVGDGDWLGRLLKEKDAFIARAWAAYQQRCPGQANIVLGEVERREIMEESESEEAAVVEQFVREKLVVGERESCSPCDLQNAFIAFATAAQLADGWRAGYTVLKRKLKELGIRNRQRTDGRRFYEGLALRKETHGK
jgi:hypothetical protein